MWCENQRPCITENDGRRATRKRVDCAVNAVADPENCRGAADCHVFAAVKRTHTGDCRDKNGAVETPTDRKRLSIACDVNVRLRALADPNILSVLQVGGVSDCHSFVQETDIFDLGRHRLCELIFLSHQKVTDDPVLEDVDVHLC